MKKRRLDFESLDVSVNSIEAMDSLLLNESISIKSEDSLLRMILKLGSGYRELLRHIQLEFLNDSGLSLLSEYLVIPPESVWECAAERISHRRSPFDSPISSRFPAILAEFREKRFSLLGRGSRDGFGASEFHHQCDGHSSNLTVFSDTKGNIFGDFTPLKWDSNYGFRADDSLKSFLFTLKNSHNILARRFALKVRRPGRQSNAVALAVQCLCGVMALVFPMTVTETPRVTRSLTVATPTIPDWTAELS
jgi:hypothetical protein